MALKNTKIIDLNLFSGSSELLRQAVKGFYYDSGNGSIEFESCDLFRPSPIQIEKTEFGEVDDSSDLILPRIKYATRLYANDANSSLVSDDNWKTFIMGGNYGNNTYPGVYNTNVYGEHFNTSSLPLLPREVTNTSEGFSLSLTTEYFNYHPRFQTSVTSKDSELEIPNFYLLDSASYLIPQAENTQIVQSRFQYSEIRNFLTNSYVNSVTEKNTELENLFILDFTLLSENNGLRLDTEDLLAHGGFDDDFSCLYSLMPYGNKIYIDEDLVTDSQQTDFREIINEHDYQVKFIKLLKEVFQGESSLQTSTANFVVNTEANVSTGTAFGSMENTNTVPIKIIDVPTMLLYSYRNPTSETNNITLLTGSENYSEQKDYAFDTTGIYRYENTSASLGVLNTFVQTIKSKFQPEPVTYNLENFLNQSDSSKYYETVAFRVEKIGGPPTGDSNTENTIQNIWFYNRGEQIKYLDTQIKYNADYTYKIYKYDIVQGYKYQLSDIATTRQLSVTSSGETNIYCLEFYNPDTGQTTNNLLSNTEIENRVTQRKRFLDSVLNRLKQYRHNVDLRLNDTTQFLNLLNIFESQRRSTMFLNTDLANRALQAYNNNQSFYDRYFPDFDPSTNSVFPYHEINFTITKPIGYPELPDLSTYQFKLAQGAVNSWMQQPNQSMMQFIDLNEGYAAGIYDAYTELYTKLNNNFEQLRSAASNVQEIIDPLEEEQTFLQNFIDGLLSNELFSEAQINSSYRYLADFNITIEPSLKIIEIPIEEKRMRIVDHPPNDFVITPRHLLDQSNRLAFYCKYDTFSVNAVTYPPTLTAQDEANRDAYLTGHDFISISELTQESVSRARFIEVYRTTTKPKSYSDFTGNLRKTIDLRQTNGDILTDHLFIERVRENTKYYYAFRAVNENGVAGQMSPVFEAELINDGGYVYAKFEQYSEEDLAVPPPKEPLIGFKKLFNIIPNIQHLQLDTSAVNFASSSVSQMSQVALGTSAEDDLWDQNKYYKIRLTSKKTGKKIDLNIGFKKEERN